MPSRVTAIINCRRRPSQNVAPCWPQTGWQGTHAAVRSYDNNFLLWLVVIFIMQWTKAPSRARQGRIERASGQVRKAPVRSAVTGDSKLNWPFVVAADDARSPVLEQFVNALFIQSSGGEVAPWWRVVDSTRRPVGLPSATLSGAAARRRHLRQPCAEQYRTTSVARKLYNVTARQRSVWFRGCCCNVDSVVTGTTTRMIDLSFIVVVVLVVVVVRQRWWQYEQ